MTTRNKRRICSKYFKLGTEWVETSDSQNMWARRGSRMVPRSTTYETQRHSDSHWGRPTLKMHSLYVGHQMACGGALSWGLGWRTSLRGGGGSLGAVASAAQQTGGDVLLLGSNSHRFITSAEELHLAFHPPTPPPPPPPPGENMIWYVSWNVHTVTPNRKKDTNSALLLTN